MTSKDVNLSDFEEDLVLITDATAAAKKKTDDDATAAATKKADDDAKAAATKKADDDAKTALKKKAADDVTAAAKTDEPQDAPKSAQGSNVGKLADHASPIPAHAVAAPAAVAAPSNAKEKADEDYFAAQMRGAVDVSVARKLRPKKKEKIISDSDSVTSDDSSEEDKKKKKKHRKAPKKDRKGKKKQRSSSSSSSSSPSDNKKKKRKQAKARRSRSISKRRRSPRSTRSPAMPPVPPFSSTGPMVTYVPPPAVAPDTRTVNPFSAMKVAPNARPEFPWSDEVRRARNPAELVQVLMPLLIRDGAAGLGPIMVCAVLKNFSGLELVLSTGLDRFVQWEQKTVARLNTALPEMFMAAKDFWAPTLNSMGQGMDIEIPTEANAILPLIKRMYDSLSRQQFRTVVRVAGKMVLVSRLLAQFGKGFVHSGFWSPTLIQDLLWPEMVVTSLLHDSDWPWMSLAMPIELDGPLRNLGADDPAVKVASAHTLTMVAKGWMTSAVL